jgi:hypothetical protein
MRSQLCFALVYLPDANYLGADSIINTDLHSRANPVLGYNQRLSRIHPTPYAFKPIHQAQLY